MRPGAQIRAAIEVLEEVLRLAADYAARRNAPATVDDIITVLVDYRASMFSQGDAENRKTAILNATLADWIASCAKLRREVSDGVLVLPAHNEPFRGLHARLQHLVDGHERSLERLEKRLREKPRRVVDLFGALFAREIGSDLLGLATGETLAHLNCLIGRGRAVRQRQADGTDLYGAA